MFPPTPRMKTIALPDEFLEDAEFIANAMLPGDPITEGKSLGLLGTLSFTTSPPKKEKEGKRLSLRLQVLSSEPKTHPRNSSSSAVPVSPTSPGFAGRHSSHMGH